MPSTSRRPTWRQLAFAVAAVAAAAVVVLRATRSSTDEIVVLRSSSQNETEIAATPCPEGRCKVVDVDSFRCTLMRRLLGAKTVVITGHTFPPEYLGHDAEYVAAAITCFQPDLVVLDTCYGFSQPLLGALSRRRLRALVVGPTYLLPPAGLLYGDGFFGRGSPSDRASAIKTRSGAKLERWTTSAQDLEAAELELESWSPSRLTSNLQTVMPNLVRVPLGAATMVVPVAPERFRRQP